MFSFEKSYRVYLNSDAISIKFNPAEHKSRILSSESTSWKLKVSAECIKKKFKLYVNIMEVNNPKSMPNSILIRRNSMTKPTFKLPQKFRKNYIKITNKMPD